MRHDCCVAELFSQLERTGPPRDGAFEILGVHRELTEIAVDHAELASGRQILQEPQGLPTGVLRFLYAPGTPQALGQQRQRSPLAEEVAEFTSALDRALQGGDRIVREVGQVALVRAALEQCCPDVRREVIGESERPRELRGRFAMRTDPGRMLGCRRRELHHRGSVARGLRVMRESGQIASTGGRCLQRLQRPSVQSYPAVRRQRFLDRDPGEFVPERDSTRTCFEHAGTQAMLECIDSMWHQRIQQPQFGLRRRDGNGFEHRRRGRVQPGDPRKNRIAHRGRDLAGCLRKCLGDEE